MTLSSVWSALKSAVLKVFVFWVLLFAVYLALGRQLFPYIENYEESIEQWLSGQFQTKVELGSVKGQWARFGPVVTLTDVEIGESLKLEEMVLAPGVFESLSHGGLSFLKFELRGFKGHLFQAEQGWQLEGLDSAQQQARQAFDFEKLLELLQRQQNIQFIGSTLTISPLDLPSFDLQLNNGELSGYEGQNSLVADAHIQYLDLSVPVQLQAEFYQLQPNLNKIYLKHGAIDFSPWLDRLASVIGEARSSGEYWLNFNGTRWRSLTARSQIESLQVEGAVNPVRLTQFKSTVFVERQENGISSKAVIDSYLLNGQRAKPTELRFESLENAYQLAWTHLPASIVGAWLSMNDTAGFWRQLNLQGDVENGVAQLTKGEQANLKLVSHFNNTRMDAYKGIPGLTNLSGIVTVDDLQGQVQLSPSESQFTYPVLNESTLNAAIESSTVSWQIVKGIGVLLEGKHRASVKAPGVPELPLQAQWFTSLKNKASLEKGFESSLGLSLFSPEFSESWINTIATSQLVPEVATNFIEKNLIAANAQEVSFSFLSRGQGETRHSQFDLAADITETELTFLEDWLPINVSKGQLLLNEQGLTAQIESAQYDNFNVSRGNLSLEFNSGDLNVDFSTDGNAADYLELFKTGPLQAFGPEVITDWQASGAVHSEVFLAVNLDDPSALEITTISDMSSGQLSLTDLGLNFTDINGFFQFDNSSGFQAQNIELSHAGIAQEVSLNRDLNDENQLVAISAKGSTALSFWGRYFNDPYLMGFNETIEHKTEIKIYDNYVRIQINSDLTGPEFNFPIPLNKASADAWPTIFDINIDESNRKTVLIDVGDRLQGYIALSPSNEIENANISVGQPLSLNDEPGVYIDVQTHFLDGQAWWQTVQNLRSIYAQKPTGLSTAPSFESKLKEINLRANMAAYLGRDWSQAKVQLMRNSEAWLVEFETDEGAGNVLIPHDNTPMFADIEWLTLTTEESELPLQEQSDPLASYLPSDVPSMEVQLKKLLWNGQDMGDWRANLASFQDRLVVSSIVGNMPGATLMGEMTWQHIDQEHFTDFTGEIATGDVLTVLNEWEYAPVLTSRDGVFRVALNWLGSPAFFDFKRVQGKINLALTKGAILKVEEYEGIKLIGLLNFTRVLQRIALDFSDLLSSGITFDTIEGELLFDRGFARVGEGLVIDGASTNFRFSGDADLLANVIDIDMVLTVPLSSTFPLVALLAGVSPQAAAAIYVTERVFNNELKKISSARMHITGSFEEPIIKFYRVFDSQLGTEEQSVTDRIKSVVPSTANP